MKSKRLTLSVLFVVAAVARCTGTTNLIVSKNASADGSTIVLILPIPVTCSAKGAIILPVCTRKVR